MPPSITASHSMSEFERLVMRLGLVAQEEILKSREVIWWVQENANRRYVPEWLLQRMGIDVELHGGY
jgi:hypothetical protein